MRDFQGARSVHRSFPPPHRGRLAGAERLLQLAALLVLCACRAGTSSDLAVAGERFTPRQIVDTAHQAMVAVAYMAPASWKDQSAVIWNYPNINIPFTLSVTVTNPANAEAFFSSTSRRSTSPSGPTGECGRRATTWAG